MGATLNLTLDRYGQVFVSLPGRGASAGSSFGSGRFSWSLQAEYLARAVRARGPRGDQTLVTWPDSSAEESYRFHEGLAATGSAFYWLGGSLTQTAGHREGEPNRISLGLGIGSPQAGAGLTIADLVFDTPIAWGACEGGGQ